MSQPYKFFFDGNVFRTKELTFEKDPFAARWSMVVHRNLQTKKCVKCLGTKETSIIYHKRFGLHSPISMGSGYTRSIHIPSTTPQMKLPFFVLRFAAPFVSVIADRAGQARPLSRIQATAGGNGTARGVLQIPLGKGREWEEKEEPVG